MQPKFAATTRSFLNKARYRYLIYATLAVLLIGIFGFRILENWRWIDCANYAVSTMVTTGNAGVLPVTDGGKLFNIIYMFISVTLILFFVSTLQQYFHDKHQSYEVKHERRKQIVEKHLDSSTDED